VNLKSEGDRLLPQATGAQANPNDIAVKIAIKETTATPVPPQAHATRPYLGLSNGSDRPLQFRLLTRLKGSNEYREEDSPAEAVNPGAMIAVKCWESGSQLEEMVLYQFTLGPKAPWEPQNQRR